MGFGQGALAGLGAFEGTLSQAAEAQRLEDERKKKEARDQLSDLLTAAQIQQVTTQAAKTAAETELLPGELDIEGQKVTLANKKFELELDKFRRERETGGIDPNSPGSNSV